MTTATKEFKAIQQHAESIKNDEAHTLETMSVGDCWYQGDVRIMRLPALPPNCEPIKGEAQLAPGNTQGSRHILSSLAGIEMFRLADATPLDGPVFKADRPVTVTHPEHGDLTLNEPGIYGVTYQRQFAEELRRVAD